MANFNERLIELQGTTKHLKKDIANAVGISTMAYYRYETGDRQPTLPVLVRLADYFDVSLDYLVGRSDDPRRR